MPFVLTQAEAAAYTDGVPVGAIKCDHVDFQTIKDPAFRRVHAIEFQIVCSGYPGDQSLKGANVRKVTRFQRSLAGGFIQLGILIEIILAALANIGHIRLERTARGVQVHDQLVNEDRLGTHVGKQAQGAYPPAGAAVDNEPRLTLALEAAQQQLCIKDPYQQRAAGDE